MSDAEFDVRHIAGLARLELDDREVETFRAQLAQILAHVNQLRQLDVTGIEPMAHACPARAALRADEARPGLPRGEALAMAPRAANDLFLVTKVIE